MTGSLAHAAASYSYVDLIGTLTNLEHLAALPSAGEKSAEWTSRDRASTYDSASAQYLNWNANNDGTGNLGTQADGGIIIAQMTGPGCLWRMWSAQVGTGHVKIFLDGSDTPAVDLAYQDYFNRTQFPFNYPALTYTVCGGFDSYLPIPYNTSCKVVAYGSWGQYFHFNYSTFAADVTVPTFTTNLSAPEQTALSNVNDFFVNQSGSDPAGARNGEITTTNSYAIAPGQSITNLNLSGQGAITTFKVRVTNMSGIAAQWRALRELTVSMFWDGEANPSIWAPVGDFFGNSCGYISYGSLPLGMGTNGWMYCHWYMPFASGAQLVLGNDGTATRNVEVIVTHAPLTQPSANLMRFHAKWNRGTYVTANGRSPDYRFLNVNGQGRFVGLAMHVYQTIDFSPGPWWGEGDEKFFVDGETTPSWFGTGSEDYFGLAWGTPGYFSQPYHSQLLAPSGNLYAPGNRALNRFHVTDNVPFQGSFDGCIEKWQYTNDNLSRYAMMPYWYLAAGGIDPYTPQPLSARTNYYVPDIGFAWQNTNGGLWSAASNWQNSAIADGAGMGADFSGLDLTTDAIVQLDSPRALGSLVFGDAEPLTPGSWIVSNNGNTFNSLTITGANAAITVNANSDVTINAALKCGSNLTKTGAGTLTLGGSATLAGLQVNGGTSVITNTTSIVGTGSSVFYLGNASPSYNGTLILQNGSKLTVAGSFADSGVIGRDGGTGTIIHNGGTFSFNPGNMNYLFVGAANNAATRAEYDMNGGLLNLNGHILGVGLGAGVVITGIVNQVCGVITNVGTLNLGALSGNGFGAYSLSGGGIYIGSGGITTGSGSYLLNLGGGTIGASANWSSPLAVSLTGSNGPVQLDTAGHNVTLSGILSGGGGLVKLGTGILELSGANTFKGNVGVNAGILKLDLPGNSARVFRVNTGGSLNLNYTGTGTVDNFYTNGIALPNGSYNATNLPGFITGTGSLQVVAAILNTPVPIGYNVNGAQISLSWPPNYQGWILQEQTNPLTSGLSMNWLDVTGTTNVTNVTMTIDPLSPLKFYRLRYPL